MRQFYIVVLWLCSFSFAKGQGCTPGVDFCEPVPLFCGYALENFTYSNVGIPSYFYPQPQCTDGNVQPHNSQFFRIIPCSDWLDLTVFSNTTTNGQGLQLALYLGTGGCEAPPVTVACDEGEGFYLIPVNLATGVIPGAEYILQVDGYEGDECDYTIQVHSGMDVSPPPAWPAPVSGSITGSSTSICTGSGAVVVSFSASWPGCSDFSTPQQTCFIPPPGDSCAGVRWTLPPGAVVIGQPYDNPILVNFHNVLPGNYTILANPMTCGCPDMCSECQPACCPTEEASLDISVAGSCNQNCEVFQSPAPPGDHCADAPFFCGNYLDGYCASNAGLGPDQVAGTALSRSGFLRLSPCEDTLHLRLRVRDCTQGGSLIFHLMRGTCEAGQFIRTLTIQEGVTADFIVPDVEPGETYFLVFAGGPLGNICEFYIEVIDGIGTQAPGTATCDCTNGTIEGPSELCPADVATYTLSPGSCEVTYAPGATLGNGYFCCPEETPDTIDIVWHIPESMNFLSDSINVNSITIQVDSSLLGIDTTITAQIWISFEPRNVNPHPNPNNPADSLVYCDCGGADCLPGIQPKTVEIKHKVEYETCVLTCYEPICVIDGLPYAYQRTDTLQTNCVTKYINVLDERYPPPMALNVDYPVLDCYHPTATLSVITPIPSASFSWTGPVGGPPFAHTASIVVGPPGGTYSCEVTNPDNGCTDVRSVNIVADFTLPVVVAGPDVTICLGESVTLSSQGSSSDASYNWSGPSFNSPFPSVIVSPSVTTTYTLTVRSLDNGCPEDDQVTITVIRPDTLELGEIGRVSCEQPCITFAGVEYCSPGTYVIPSGDCEVSRFSIGEDLTLPIDTLPVVTLCEGECYTFYGQEYCATTTVSQEDNCTIFVQEIVVNPRNTIQAGMVGSVSCDTTCVTYLGRVWCEPGHYVDTAGCVITQFEIGFVRDTVDLGIADTLTCQHPCFTFLQETYCEPVDYIVTDSCTVYRFTLNSNQSAPTHTPASLHCLPNNQSYTVGFQIIGVPPYKVNGMLLSGSYFLSDPVPNGAPYAFVIEQVNNGCQVVANGAYDCAFMCGGSTGAMENSQLDVCGETAVQVAALLQPQAAGMAVARYVLHTLPDAVPGTVLAENEEGIFIFNPASMTWEQTYYISSAVGTLSPGGALDFDNLCTRIAPGQPVVFHAPPAFGEILAENPSCFGESDGALNILAAEGAAPLTYAIDDGAFGSQPFFDGLAAGTYQLSLRDAWDCSIDSFLTLVNPDSLWLDAGPDREIAPGESVLLQAQSNVPDALVQWTNPRTRETKAGVDWWVQLFQPTTYLCMAVDENGCEVRDEVLVRVKKGQVYYPNVLFRNSAEPANQSFTLFSHEGYVQQIKSLQIFDRWGGLVFRRDLFTPNIPELGWNGTINGAPVNSAVFVFVAEVLLADGRVQIIKGDVTVL